MAANCEAVVGGPNGHTPAELSCCICGNAKIPAPQGANERTRFTCRACVGLAWRRRNKMCAIAARMSPVESEG